jgi:O-acetyl-ADP-ribose deacetylase (regulator of RNase III)
LRILVIENVFISFDAIETLGAFGMATTQIAKNEKGLQVRELFYITHIDNLSSILKDGILAHKQIEKLGIAFKPIYNKEIVSRRKTITTPDGRSLWDFANLYFQPRNPMMFQLVRNDLLEHIAVVGVDKVILNQPDIFLTDGNAAHSQSEFFNESQKAKVLPKIMREIDALYWNEADGSKRKIMAECLVPERVLPDLVRSVYFGGNYNVKFKIQESLRNPKNISFMYLPGMFFQTSKSRQITPLLSVLVGDMFFSRAQTLTVSVNIKGIMGKGVASRAKYQFPDVYVRYQDACRNGKLKMGKPWLYKREISTDCELADDPESLINPNGETWFLLFPTKKHWRDNSKIEDIEAGLVWLSKNYQKEGIKSLALPALGCGLGGLDWANVGPLLCKYLSTFEIPVCIYLPAEKRIPDYQVSSEFLLPKQR